MHPRTVATLDDLRASDWFSNVGVANTQAAIVLSTWQEAIQSCSSAKWENLCLEAANQYRESLVGKMPKCLGKWNDIVDEVKKATKPLVQEKIAVVVQERSLPKEFEDCVQWDIMHVCMEAEYADIYPPGFYASQAYWYVNGHFPCGWQGNFPNGKLVVY